ncbi:MAG: Spx/MgsR family RNA polymerase-binding regulatory protein [Pisciglobus halotolerans]|nr:Spx/MgsR family RNA polymerase-binding regulatory protein [Pisciglobus halotolerans]
MKAGCKKVITFYCIPNCTTCSNAPNWLDAEGIQYVEYNLKRQTPLKEELIYWMEQSKLPVKSFFNTNGKSYREKRLKEKVAELTTEAATILLSADGMLIKCPFAVTSKQCIIGFKEENYQNKWKKESRSNE